MKHAKTEEKVHNPERNNANHSEITKEEPIVIEDKVFSTYSEFMKFINSSEQYDDEWKPGTTNESSEEIQSQSHVSETMVESMFAIDKNINSRDPYQTREHFKYDSQDKNDMYQRHNDTVKELQDKLCKGKKLLKSSINNQGRQNLRSAQSLRCIG